MFKTHTKGTHDLKRTRVKMPSGMANGDPYYRCLKCGKTHRDSVSTSWDESCQEYLQRQYEHKDSSHTNPARQQNLENLSFDEVFQGCADPLEFLERRSVTIDTHFGTVPQDWA